MLRLQQACTMRQLHCVARVGAAGSSAGRQTCPWARRAACTPRRPLRSAAVCSVPAWNPQNVPNPEVMPSPEFSAEQAVRVQLDALSNNDTPWPNHGVQTLYEFAEDVGGLDPSYYFGFRKDLYHFDHFMGLFVNKMGVLVNCSSYSIESVSEGPGLPAGPWEDGSSAEAVVLARVQGAGSHSSEEALVEFQLKRKKVGARKGSYATAMLRKVAQP